VAYLEAVVVDSSVNLRPDVVSGRSLSWGVVSLCGRLLAVGHDWAQDVEVKSTGTLGSRELEPEYEEGLEGIVEREVIQDGPQSD